MFSFFTVFLASSLDNFFHPISISLVVWILVLFFISKIFKNQSNTLFPLGLILFSSSLSIIYFFVFLYNEEISLSLVNITSHIKNIADKVYLDKLIELVDDSVSTAGILESRTPNDLFFSIFQLLIWTSIVFITISQKINDKLQAMNTILLGSSLYLFLSWSLDLIFLLTFKPEFLDENHFHGISSEPHRQSELAFIHIFLLFTKINFNKETRIEENKTEKRIIFFGSAMAVLNLLYLSNLNFLYSTVLFTILYFFCKNEFMSKLIFLTSLVIFFGYLITLLYIDKNTVIALLKENEFFDHTWEYQFQNHLNGAKLFLQCGIFGCGFGTWHPAPNGWDPIIIVSGSGGWMDLGTPIAKDVASLWVRLLKDVGLISIFFMFYFFMKLKFYLFSKSFYPRVLGLGILIYAASRMFHSGFYFNADLFLILMLLHFFSDNKKIENK